MTCVLEAVRLSDDCDGYPYDWPEVTPAIRDLAALVAAFYERPGMSTGGPLHVYLDDFNLDDEIFHLDDEHDYLSAEAIWQHLRNWSTVYLELIKGDDGVMRTPTPRCRELTLDERAGLCQAALEIVWRLAVLAEPERHVAVAFGHGMLVEEHYPPEIIVPEVVRTERNLEPLVMPLDRDFEVSAVVYRRHYLTEERVDEKLISAESSDVVVGRTWQSDLPLGPMLVEPLWATGAAAGSWFTLGFEVGTETGGCTQLGYGTLDLEIVRADWEGVLTVEGVPSGDRRLISEGCAEESETVVDFVSDP